MPHVVRRSLLFQLLSVYLLFVFVVLASGIAVNAVVEQQLRHDAQVSEQALGQEVSREASLQLNDALHSLVVLGNLALSTGGPSHPEALINLFRTYQAARNDIDHVSWLDPFGALRVSWPSSQATLGAEFSPPDIVQWARIANGPVFDVGIAVETTFNAGVIMASPVRDAHGQLVGIVAVNLSLMELSEPLVSVVHEQQQQGRHLSIGIIDSDGVLIATPDHQRIMQTILDAVPDAAQALQGHIVSSVSLGTDGQDWLSSAVPVNNAHWAVVVQMPTSEALAVVAQFHLWLFYAAGLFVLAGLLFWLILLLRVIQPLHILALQHQILPGTPAEISRETHTFAERLDEMGDLARSLMRLELDGLAKLSELRTLLETSNAVVGSLEPHAVVGQIIREVRRLVDVQAAAVLLPDKQGVMHVLVSDGHSEHYNQTLSLAPDNEHSSSVMALRTGKPVQKILSPDQLVPALSYEEGFRSVLAIPIISRHAGAVVLQVHRIQAHPFDQNEIDLLLTFANYATLAWEHAVLYERSDERLHQVAQENERLYRQAAEEKQRLAAIMGSMSDGLVLTGIDGRVLYINQSASAMVGLKSSDVEHLSIRVFYRVFCSLAVEPDACLVALERASAGEPLDVVMEIRRPDRENRLSALHLRRFTVGDASGSVLGSGLLLRDVTREHEIGEFKTTLLAAVGHELRTPLTVIKGYASTLLQDDVVWTQADQQHFLQTISRESDRVARLVSNLLDLSRQEAGLLSLKRSPVHIQDLLTTTIERLRQPGITFSVQVQPDLPLVNVDRDRVEVVLYNLLSNALTYGENEVRVSARRQEESIIVAVTDNGPGIASEELPHIFERFYRAHHGRQRRSAGTGLGLAISKAFIQAHGGTIWAESSEQGTTIAFSLPIYSPTDEQTTTNTDLAPLAGRMEEH